MTFLLKKKSLVRQSGQGTLESGKESYFLITTGHPQFKIIKTIFKKD